MFNFDQFMEVHKKKLRLSKLRARYAEADREEKAEIAQLRGESERILARRKEPAAPVHLAQDQVEAERATIPHGSSGTSTDENSCGKERPGNQRSLIEAPANATVSLTSIPVVSPDAICRAPAPPHAASVTVNPGPGGTIAVSATSGTTNSGCTQPSAAAQQPSRATVDPRIPRKAGDNAPEESRVQGGPGHLSRPSQNHGTTSRARPCTVDWAASTPVPDARSPSGAPPLTAANAQAPELPNAGSKRPKTSAVSATELVGTSLGPSLKRPRSNPGRRRPESSGPSGPSGARRHGPAADGRAERVGCKRHGRAREGTDRKRTQGRVPRRLPPGRVDGGGTTGAQPTKHAASSGNPTAGDEAPFRELRVCAIRGGSVTQKTVAAWARNIGRGGGQVSTSYAAGQTTHVVIDASVSPETRHRYRGCWVGSGPEPGDAGEKTPLGAAGTPLEKAEAHSIAPLLSSAWMIECLTRWKVVPTDGFTLQPPGAAIGNTHGGAENNSRDALEGASNPSTKITGGAVENGGAQAAERDEPGRARRSRVATSAGNPIDGCPERGRRKGFPGEGVRPTGQGSGVTSGAQGVAGGIGAKNPRVSERRGRFFCQSGSSRNHVRPPSMVEIAVSGDGIQGPVWCRRSILEPSPGEGFLIYAGQPDRASCASYSRTVPCTGGMAPVRKSAVSLGCVFV